jgi:hypothetical protein
MARHGALIRSPVANALLFQAAWFSAVLGAAYGEPLWSWAVLGLLTAQTLTTVQWRMDLAFAVVCMAIGVLVDSVWAWSGVIDYKSEGLAPGWIVTLWAATGLSINHSLGWFRPRPLIGGIAAGAIAPLSYLAGEQLGAVVIPSVPALGWIALCWLPVFSILFALAHVLDRHMPGAHSKEVQEGR